MKNEKASIACATAVVTVWTLLGKFVDSRLDLDDNYFWLHMYIWYLPGPLFVLYFMYRYTPRDETWKWTDEISGILGVLLGVPIGMFVVSSLVIGVLVAQAECILKFIDWLERGG